MAVCMDKIVLHEHLEEGGGSDPGDNFVQLVVVLLVISDW